MGERQTRDNNAADAEVLRFDDFDAHLTAGTGDDAVGGFRIIGIEIGHFLLHDFHDLFLVEAGDFRLIRFFRAGGDFRHFLDQNGRWRLFRDEGERFVFIDGDDDRQQVAIQLLGFRIESFAEFHDIHAGLAERGTDRRSRISLPGGDLEFHHLDNFLGHIAMRVKNKAARKARPI